MTGCGFHHRLVHDRRWKIAGDPNRNLVWVRPDGRPLETGPDPLREPTRRHIVDPITIRGTATTDTS